MISTKQNSTSEIDHRPAATVYNEWTNFHLGGSYYLAISLKNRLFILGKKSRFILQLSVFQPLISSIRETECDGIELFTDINEGDTGHLMQGSKQQLISRAANIIHSSYNDMDLEEKFKSINICKASSMLNP